MPMPRFSKDSRANFVDFPQVGAHIKWMRRLHILAPFYYFSEHCFPIKGGNTAYAYCLGSPAGGFQVRAEDEVYALDPEGVQQCRTITVPVRLESGEVIERPLHDADDGGQRVFHVLVWNWDKNTVEILKHKSDASLYNSLLTIGDRISQQDPSKPEPLVNVDVIIQAETQGNAFRYVCTQDLQPPGDIQQYMDVINAQVSGAGEEDGGIPADFNPIATRDDIAQRLTRLAGRDTAQAPPVATPPVPALLPPPVAAPLVPQQLLGQTTPTVSAPQVSAQLPVATLPDAGDMNRKALLPTTPPPVAPPANPLAGVGLTPYDAGTSPPPTRLEVPPVVAPPEEAPTPGINLNDIMELGNE